MGRRSKTEIAVSLPKCAHCGKEDVPAVTLVGHGGAWDALHCCSWECAAFLALTRAKDRVPPEIAAEWQQLQAKVAEEQVRQQRKTAEKYRQVFGRP